MMTAQNNAGQLASIARFKEEATKFKGVYYDKQFLGFDQQEAEKQLEEIKSYEVDEWGAVKADSSDGDAATTDLVLETPPDADMIQNAVAGVVACPTAIATASTAAPLVVVSHSEGLGQLLRLLSMDVDFINVDFPSEFAERCEMIVIRMVPEIDSVAKYFGFPEPFHEPRATARCGEIDELHALQLVLAKFDSEKLPVADIMKEINNKPFRVINVKSKALAENEEGATCLTAILKYVSTHILKRGGSARGVTSSFGSGGDSPEGAFGLSKDYSFAALHHMVVCNEPNAQHVLEWHNWTVIGLLFKLAAHVRKAKGLTIYRQYLTWIAWVNSNQT